MIRAHKIRLRPTEEQKQHLFRAFAAARNAWNWGKEVLDFEYDLNRELFHDYNIGTNGFTYTRNLKKTYNKVKPDWVKDQTASATQEAFDDLQRAIKRYFDIRTGKITIDLKRGEDGNIKSRRDRRNHGWLNWRSKRKHNGFRVTNVYLKDFEFGSTEIRYNAKVGYIKMCEGLRFNGKIMNATFSYDGQWFWVSVQVEFEVPELPRLNESVGVDLGVNYLVVTSDGVFKENPKSYYHYQAKLRRLQRRLDRQRRANNPNNYDDKGRAKRGKQWSSSERMKKIEFDIQKTHNKIRNIRRNAQHQLTAEIAAQYGFVVVEDLNVKGMLKNRRLAKAISDAGFHEIRRQLTYKSEVHQGVVQVVDRWFPSSKLCSNCNHKNLDLKLSDRLWFCPECGQENERDLNAAINLKNEGFRIFGKN